MKHTILLFCVLTACLTVSSRAQDATATGTAASAIPSTVFYQGYASNSAGTALASGSYSVVFALYGTASGGAALWQETHPAVQVKNGLFSVLLGKGSPAQALALPFDQQYYLGIRIGADPEFAPRVALSSAPYSFSARVADSTRNVDWSSIRNIPAGFADGIDNTGGSGSAGVSTLNGKSGDLALTAGSNVTIESVDASTIRINATAGGGNMHTSVYDANANGDVDRAEVAATVPDNAIGTRQLADKSVTGDKLADDAIRSSKIPSATLVKSINSIQDDLFIYGGGNITVSTKGNGITISTPDRLGAVTHDGSLDGDGTGGNALRVADASITKGKLADATAVRSINSIQDDLFIYGGGNVTVETKNNTLTISSPNVLTTVEHDATLQGNGTAGKPLGLDFPLLHTSSSSGAIIGVTQSGAGSGIQAAATTGNAGKFTGSSTPAGSATLLVQSTGLGMAGRFEIDNTSNNSSALWAQSNGTGKAGYFLGNVQVVGSVAKSSGTFMIDHPLDPANKYLYHSFVESPDMMNIYKGTVRLNANGEALVSLPAYFEALNMDVDYQLTAVGAAMPNLHIAREVSGNTFAVAGGAPNGKASWMVTAVRNDPYAKQHRVVPEVDKEPENRGRYLNPVEWKQPAERGIGRATSTSAHGHGSKPVAR